MRVFLQVETDEQQVVFIHHIAELAEKIDASSRLKFPMFDPRKSSIFLLRRRSSAIQNSKVIST